MTTQRLTGEAMKLARKLANGPTVALSLIAGCIGQSRQLLRRPAQPRIRVAATAGSSEDFKDGVTAFLEKRPAKFKGKVAKARHAGVARTLRRIMVPGATGATGVTGLVGCPAVPAGDLVVRYCPRRRKSRRDPATSAHGIWRRARARGGPERRGRTDAARL